MDINVLAHEMLAAYSNGTAIETPSSRFADFDVKAGYAVEAEFARLRFASGAKRAGLKVGYANKAMWRALKLETLVWAHMYDDTVQYESNVLLPYWRSPKIEPEIVFKMKAPISARGLTAEDALKNVEWLAIGFEVIDCPFPNWEFKPADFIAAFGLHLRLVVGEPLVIEESMIPELTSALAQFKVRLSKNGEFVEEGAGKNSLRNPALCLAELGGAAGLDAGDLVSSGTLTSGQLVNPAENWRVEVEGLPLPSLAVEFW